MIQFNTEALYIAFVVANRPDGVHQQTAAISYLVRAYELAGSCSCSRQRCTLVTKNPSTRTRGYSPSRQYSSRVRVAINSRREFGPLINLRNLGECNYHLENHAPWVVYFLHTYAGNSYQKVCRAIHQYLVF